MSDERERFIRLARELTDPTGRSRDAVASGWFDVLHGLYSEAFGNMSVCDYENLKSELRWILMHGGHPPNWVPR